MPTGAMTFLITGATGFLGRRLVDMLIAEGHAVVYLAGKRSKSLDFAPHSTYGPIGNRCCWN